MNREKEIPEGVVRLAAESQGRLEMADVDSITGEPLWMKTKEARRRRFVPPKRKKKEDRVLPDSKREHRALIGRALTQFLSLADKNFTQLKNK